MEASECGLKCAYPSLPASQISLGSDRVIPLAAFRGTTRPVIIAGSRGQISRALAAAEPCREALRERGISVVPIQLSAEDVGEKLRQLKAEFGGAAAAPASKGFGGAASGSSKAAPEAAAVPAAASGLTSKVRWGVSPSALESGADRAWSEVPGARCPPLLCVCAEALKAVCGSVHIETVPHLHPLWPLLPTLHFCLQDRRWQLKPHNDAEWQQWLLEQKQASGINADTIYVQVRALHWGGWQAFAHLLCCTCVWQQKPKRILFCGSQPPRSSQTRPLVASNLPNLPPPVSQPFQPRCTVQVQLDGTVRASGAGMPPWTQFLDDIPELGDIRTKVTDGIGR
jgi:hypothetical protein